jgi:hypothetical protein
LKTATEAMYAQGTNKVKLSQKVKLKEMMFKM